MTDKTSTQNLIPQQLTPQQRRELAARAICDTRTVLGVYRGKGTKPACYERVRRAAAELGFPSPPAHVPDPSTMRWSA
jgi:hypothetical protein